MSKNKLFRSFVSYYKHHFKLFILDMFCALMRAFIDLFFPMLTREVIGTVLPAGQMRIFWLFVAGMLLMYVIRTGLQYIVQYWGHVLGVRIEYDMRRDLFSHLQTLPFKFFDKTEPDI